jgi:outer membrane murein-binding lipoprotein Lpp
LSRIAAVAAAALLAAGCGGPMKQSELASSIETIESSAAEGSLIASHAYTDKTKATFVRVRAREIGEVLDHEQEKLNDAEAENDDVSADKDRAIDLADQASEQIGQLQVAPDDKAAARAISTRLRELANDASALGEHL